MKKKEQYMSYTVVITQERMTTTYGSDNHPGIRLAEVIS